MTIIDDGYSALLSAIIERALDDINGIGPRSNRRGEPDNAMAFILSETCEEYCFYLNVNYEAVKEKAAALYRHELDKEAPAKIKKSSGKQTHTFRCPQIRKPQEKRYSVAYR
jgi:hypothetical protein